MPFSHVRTWLFDLDDTLYPTVKEIRDQVDTRMNETVAKILGVSLEEAQKTRKRYFEDHGTTLRGLMTEAGIEPRLFLDPVHDLDLSAMPRCPLTHKALEQIEGRKIIFTNAPRSHAENVLTHLGIRDQFEDIFDIIEAGYQPKPNPATYQNLIKKFDLTPADCCFFDDLAKNLKPAFDAGMSTVWIHGDLNETRSDGGADAGLEGEHIRHRAEKLSDFFETHILEKK